MIVLANREGQANATIYQEKPFFLCYVEEEISRLF
jgi:hypothetical protein